MDLLYRREQTTNVRGRVVFRLWAKAEMNEDERALLDRYKLYDSCVLEGDDTGLLKWAAAIGFVVFLVVALMVFRTTYDQFSALGYGALAGIGAGYWWRNERRETIFMKDLVFGRRFKCASIVELVQKEAMLSNVALAVRQVLETAKHWDGVETRPVPVLSPDEAKELVIRLG